MLRRPKENPGGRTGAEARVNLLNRYIKSSRIFLKYQGLSCVVGVGVFYV
jgi:hypothetical protein